MPILFYNQSAIFHDLSYAVGLLFNGTSTQKGQFVPTAGRETAQSAILNNISICYATNQ